MKNKQYLADWNEIHKITDLKSTSIFFDLLLQEVITRKTFLINIANKVIGFIDIKNIDDSNTFSADLEFFID